MEKWKDILGWAGMYQISNKGRVRRIMDFTYSIDDNMDCDYKILQATRGSRGIRVTLCLGSKKACYFVQRLVAEAFLPNPDKLPYVLFKDGNKFNVDVSNLYWSGEKSTYKTFVEE